MAKITGYIGELSGKLGGMIFARNKGGAYVKAFATPTNPNTEAQKKARTMFGLAVSAWHALADTSKQEWNQFATTVFKPKHGAPGVVYSGFNAYVSCRNVLLNLSRLTGEFEIEDVTATYQEFNPINMDVPTAALSGNILITGLGPGGGDAVTGLNLGSGTINLTDNEVSFSFNIDQPLQVSNLLKFRDAISGEPVGLALTMALPSTQRSEFVKSPGYALIGKVEIPSITVSTIATNAFQVSGPLHIDHLKFRPVIGQVVTVSAFLVGQSGQTFPIGSVPCLTV